MSIIFKNVLVQLRKSKGCTQQHVASSVLVSRPTYIGWERNVGDLPLSKLLLLADFYELSMSDFITLILEDNKAANTSGDQSLLHHEISFLRREVQEIKEILTSPVSSIG